MNCTEVLDQLSDYADAETRAELCRLIEEHLVRCKRCKFQLDLQNKIITVSLSDGPSEAPYRVVTRLAAAMDAEYHRQRRVAD